jgi:hypothetical protein
MYEMVSNGIVNNGYNTFNKQIDYGSYEYNKQVSPIHPMHFMNNITPMNPMNPMMQIPSTMLRPTAVNDPRQNNNLGFQMNPISKNKKK